MTRCSSVAAFLLTVALAGCAADNPQYCKDDTACREDPGKPHCHGVGHFCYEGCNSDADCADTTKPWHMPSRSVCNQQTHDCEGGDGGVPDIGPDMSNLLPLGSDCTADGQCQDGHCVDGVCCESECNGLCESCAVAAKGTCTAVPAGQDPRGDCPGSTTGSIPCGPGHCDGAKACSYPNAGKPCDHVCDTGDNASVTHVCDATHKCTPSQTVLLCDPYKCDGSMGRCHEGCSANHAECIDTSVCDRQNAHTKGSGECVPVANVAKVSSGSLQTAITSALGNQTHLRVSGSYTEKIAVSTGSIVIIGDGQTSITATSTDPAVVSVTGDATVVLQGLVLAGAQDGVSCVATKASVVLIECEITDCAEQGIEAYNCDVTLRRNKIQQNGGGGALLSYGQYTVVNNLVTHNGLVASTVGGFSLLPTDGAPFVFANNTVASNGNFSNGWGVICLKLLDLHNNIIYYNDPGPLSGCTAHYSDLEGGSGTNGNIDLAPQFLGANDFRLDSTKSPCIDAGTDSVTGFTLPAIDLAGNKRQVDKLTGPAKIDIGAYEVQ